MYVKILEHPYNGHSKDQLSSRIRQNKTEEKDLVPQDTYSVAQLFSAFSACDSLKVKQ